MAIMAPVDRVLLYPKSVILKQMPKNQVKNTQQKVKKNKNPNMGKKNGGKSGQRKNGGVPRRIGPSEHAQALALLIKDPCNSLVDALPGVTGETVIRRVRTFIDCHSSAATNCGYLLWYPEFHGNGLSAGVNANLFKYERLPGNVSAKPTNTPASPLGTDVVSAPSVAGQWIQDPVNVFVQSRNSTFAGACTLAACMKFVYGGTLSNNAGFCYPIIDLAPQNFFDVAGTAVGTAEGAVSIANLQTFAKSRVRVPLEGVEVIWRPKRYLFRGPGEYALADGQGSETDTCFERGSPTINPTSLACPEPGATSGFGLAWTGLATTTTGDVFVECIKVVELQLRPSFGMIEERPPVPPSPAVLQESLDYLDSRSPNWQAGLSDVMSHTAAFLARTALGGASEFMRRRGNMVLRDRY